jgi:membrane-bound ClpP family serine protease
MEEVKVNSERMIEKERKRKVVRRIGTMIQIKKRNEKLNSKKL